MRNRITFLPNHKAPGPDGITNETLKLLDNHTISHIAHTMALVYTTGIALPSHLTHSHTIIIPKNEDTQYPKNYRPISLANTIYKLYTKTITEALTNICETNNILNTTQEGFREDKNTIRQLRNLTNIIEDAHIHRQDLYILYVDFKEAFSRVPHHMGTPNHEGPRTP